MLCLSCHMTSHKEQGGCQYPLTHTGQETCKLLEEWSRGDTTLYLSGAGSACHPDTTRV